MSENRAVSTARTATAETPKGGRGRLPRPAVVVLPENSGDDTRVVTELQEPRLGHQLGDLCGVQLGRVYRRSLQFLDGHQLFVGRDARSNGVLEGGALLQHFLALLAGDELQEFLRFV